MPSPNVLVIMTDQQQSAALSCAGNPDLHTPNLDALAARGTRFASAYTSFPLCTPARAALFSGHMPHTLGIGDNNQPIPEPIKSQTLGHLFARAGYDCAYGGKWHVTQGAMEEGFAFEPIHGFDDIGLPEATIDFLKRPREKPFLLVASFDNPHNICEHSRDQPLPRGEVSHAPTEECPNLPPNFSRGAYEPEALAVYADQARMFRRRAVFTPDRWRLLRHVYYRLVEKVDAQIGQILDALRATGQEENTLVVFTSDHGDMAGAHELNQKHSLYDELARIPLIVAGPGVAAGHVVDEPVSHVDVLPTVCDLAQVKVPEEQPSTREAGAQGVRGSGAGLHGFTLRPAVEQRPFERAPVFIELEWGDDISSAIATTARCIVTRTHKYVLHDWGANREQLFDRAADPWEQTNLAIEARHRPLVEEHRRLLRDWCRATNEKPRFTRRIHGFGSWNP